MKELTEIEMQEMINFINKKEQDNLIKGLEIANKNLWGLTNFKRFIEQFLKTQNNEDQWTFDYESYCCQLSSLKEEKYEWIHPSNWAVEYYQERWNSDKMNKSLKSLGRIAQT
tara:strand:+ start:284 stop:622 length:339 start_codon:yes stop_codon:yes gene_type:complete